MNFTFDGNKITGILTVLPANERCFLDDLKNFDFPEKRSLKLKDIMGYDKHRVVEEDTCSSDLAVHGLKYLFDKDMLDKESIDALILVTQCPDHFVPPTSNIIQGRLGLKHDVFCMMLFKHVCHSLYHFT